jgi:mRNA interferase MazF
VVEKKEEIMMEVIVNRGDVLYADLGFDGTCRQGGTRPIVIVSNQTCNRYSNIISVVCLTTAQHKANLPTHVELLASETGLARDSICLCEQPMSISKTRLFDFVTSLGEEQMKLIDNALRCQLCL